MAHAYFQATSQFYREHEAFSGTVQASALGLWKLRKDVRQVYASAGYYRTGKKPDHVWLREHYLAESGLSKADFLGLARIDGFEEEKRTLARMSLVSSVSLFEGWLEELARELRLDKLTVEALEWPGRFFYPARTGRGGQPKEGATDVLRRLRYGADSPLLSACFGPPLMSARNYAGGQLDQLYVCFRAWKEVRNGITHSGGRVSERCVRDTTLLKKVARASPPPQPLARFPIPVAPHVGHFVSLDLAEVLTFGAVLRSIVATVDAELAQSSKAEPIFFRRFNAHRTDNYSDPSMQSKVRQAQIRDMCLAAELPPPVALEQLDHALTDRYGPFLRPRAR